MRICFRRGALRLGLVGLLIGGVMLTLFVGSSTATPTATTFSYTGSEQTYTVPAGATAVTITAIGGPGSFDATANHAGGVGAAVTATVPLPAGTTTLYVEVGGAGVMHPFLSCGGSSAFNGGGFSACGGGGGGASDVRLGPRSTALTTTDSRLVVAGGGGGGGVNLEGTSGGSAGDTSASGAGSGGAGTDTTCSTLAGAAGNGGFGGTQGGSGGASDQVNFPANGNDGSLGAGGDGPTGDEWGGGGGGGYWGGGAGGSGNCGGGGGGAGSSFWVAGATNTSMSEDSTGTPSISITPVFADDLSVSKTGPAFAALGIPVTYTLTVANGGPATASGVVVTDTLPAGLQFNSATTSQGTFSQSGGTLTFNVGGLSSSGTATLTVTAIPTTTGSKIQSASVTGDQPDSNSANNSSQVTTQVVGFAPGGGAFVIGDRSTSGRVTFWSPMWSSVNKLSGGTAPSAFKGFALHPASPMCAAGVQWDTGPGTSPPPPPGPLPATMAVIVTDKATKSGKTIKGTIVHIVIVSTNAGYNPATGGAGRGTVLRTAC